MPLQKLKIVSLLNSSHHWTQVFYKFSNVSGILSVLWITRIFVPSVRHQRINDMFIKKISIQQLVYYYAMPYKPLYHSCQFFLGKIQLTKVNTCVLHYFVKLSSMYNPNPSTFHLHTKNDLKKRQAFTFQSTIQF